ncbi:ankyrin repeat-containing domain protein [Annulohypoxylon truncatum]|uniref:ankyrin repeat-containing domain protein n=1 Tax=Annulohypoxylon truncatum TaxID=327061 RepID=UPI0020083963|nr:ankyrin repeat-containing domain protein [Annulohypoxylon truncatum]KAI1207820.1 ankyrin repeat-containing domain protein [Annulohypoxylon truncatum]
MSTTPLSTSGGQKLSYDVFYIMVEEGQIDEWDDICSLRETCRTLAKILGPPLYRKDIRYSLKKEDKCKRIYLENAAKANAILSEPVYSPIWKRRRGYDESSGDDESDESYPDDRSDEDEGLFREWEPLDPSTYFGKHQTNLNRPVVFKIRRTALYWAAQKGYTEMLKTVLRQAKHTDRRYLDLKVEGGKTALGIAARNGQTEIVELLVKAGAFVDAPSPYSRTFTRRHRGARLRDVSPSHPSNFGDRRQHFLTPLGIAIRYGKEDTAISLAHHTEHLDHPGWNQWHTIISPLTLAVVNKMYGVIKVLLSRGYKDYADISYSYEREWHPMCVAASLPNNEEMLGFLISHGMGVDTKGSWGWYPLEMAVHSECVSNAIYLLGREEPGYVGDRITTALYRAMMRDRNLEVTKAIAERLNSLGHFELLQRQLCDTDFSRKRSKTLSFMANLLVSGLNKAYIREDQTYIHWILEKSDSELGFRPHFWCDITHIKEYVKDGFDINAKDRDGYTGADLAKKSGREYAYKELIS